MKKILIIGVLAAVLLAGLGFAGVAYAQTQTPPVPQDGTYPGMMGGRGGRGMMGGGGMMGAQGAAQDGTYGPLHDLMQAAMAQAFGVTVEEIQAAHDGGKTLWDLAQEKGLTQEQFVEKMQQARSQALAQAVADGLLTQEQADWMLTRMSRMGGAGTGSCMGGTQGAQGMRGGRGGGRWNNQPAQHAGSGL